MQVRETRETSVISDQYIPLNEVISDKEEVIQEVADRVINKNIVEKAGDFFKCQIDRFKKLDDGEKMMVVFLIVAVAFVITGLAAPVSAVSVTLGILGISMLGWLSCVGNRDEFEEEFEF